MSSNEVISPSVYCQSGDGSELRIVVSDGVVTLRLNIVGQPECDFILSQDDCGLMGFSMLMQSDPSALDAGVRDEILAMGADDK
jgi:hypothetical protein